MANGYSLDFFSIKDESNVRVVMNLAPAICGRAASRRIRSMNPLFSGRQRVYTSSHCICNGFRCEVGLCFCSLHYSDICGCAIYSFPQVDIPLSNDANQGRQRSTLLALKMLFVCRHRLLSLTTRRLVVGLRNVRNKPFPFEQAQTQDYGRFNVNGAKAEVSP